MDRLIAAIGGMCVGFGIAGWLASVIIYDQRATIEALGAEIRALRRELQRSDVD